jgi:methionyl-tRNA formyltransferase
MIKIRLYLLGFKGYATLVEIIKNHGSKIIDSVIIGSDNNIRNDYSDEINKTCNSNSINVILRKDDISQSDIYSLAIGWRWIIDINRVKNLIILHDSILPKYRGFNPLVSAVINGETQIGVTALFAGTSYDKGDIIYQSIRNIQYPIKINKAIECITNNYSELVLKILETLKSGRELPRIKQDTLKVTYSLWRDEEDYQINWNWDNSKIKRFIDAVGFPYLGAYSIINGVKIRILEAEEYGEVEIVNRTSGKVIYFENKCPIVVCGTGLLKIIKMINDTDGSEYVLKNIRVRFK